VHILSNTPPFINAFWNFPLFTVATSEKTGDLQALFSALRTNVNYMPDQQNREHGVTLIPLIFIVSQFKECAVFLYHGRQIMPYLNMKFRHRSLQLKNCYFFCLST
jgi:hypothetical protein